MDQSRDPRNAHRIVGDEAEISENGTGNDDDRKLMLQREGESSLVEREGSAPKWDRSRAGLRSNSQLQSEDDE